jgi:Arc/MetJ family transcription regulator
MHETLFLCILCQEEESAMRTTLDLPESLISEAMKITNIKTKTKVIITALEQLVKKSKISEIKKYKGQVDLNIDLDEIRERKCRL